MQLIIDDKYIIEEPIENIITEIKKEADWNVFKTIVKKDTYIQATCPFHKDGDENKPSFSIFTDYGSKDIAPGTFNCFTCHEKGGIIKLYLIR